jgi:hypothetical protein
MQSQESIDLDDAAQGVGSSLLSYVVFTGVTSQTTYLAIDLDQIRSNVAYLELFGLMTQCGGGCNGKESTVNRALGGSTYPG